MLYKVGKQGAVFSNGDYILPGEIIDNTYQDLDKNESYYNVAKSLSELKERKYRKVMSTMQEFDFIYDNVLQDIEKTRPLSEAKFEIGDLVKNKYTQDIGIIGSIKYDYKLLKWIYNLYTMDSITNIHSYNTSLGLYHSCSSMEDELTLAKKGQHSITIKGEEYLVSYELKEVL